MISSTLGSGLRIAVVHARWNARIIEALVAGAKKSLLGAGVAESDIVVQSIPGSYELPFAVKRYTFSYLRLSLSLTAYNNACVYDVRSNSPLETESIKPLAHRVNRLTQL